MLEESVSARAVANPDHKSRGTSQKPSRLVERRFGLLSVFLAFESLKTFDARPIPAVQAIGPSGATAPLGYVRLV